MLMDVTDRFPSNIRPTPSGVCFFSHTSLADNHRVQNKTCCGAETKEAQQGEEQMQQSVTRHDRKTKKKYIMLIFSPCCDKGNLTPRTGNNAFSVPDSTETPRRKMSNDFIFKVTKQLNHSRGYI